MRIFKHANMFGGWECPICHTSEDKPVVLIGIDGTQDGRNEQAEQVHVDCLDLRLYSDRNVIYQILGQ